jgi:WAS protein family homolog 1
MPFSVPLVTSEMRPDEGVLQMIDALDHLERVTSDVFNRIGTRINENRTQLRAINTRIATAQLKIDRIRGSNEATTILSSAKYPVADKFEPYLSVFHVRLIVRDGASSSSRSLCPRMPPPRHTRPTRSSRA